MKKYLFISLLLICFCSCECTYQYGVYLKNNTDERLKIVYKTSTDRSGVVEDIVYLEPGDYRKIIDTKNLDTKDGCGGTQAAHCTFVADYIDAFAQDTIPSTLKWCDESIEFAKTDIQQAEFTINYNKENFNL